MFYASSINLNLPLVCVTDTCNWMKFVRPATASKEQNLVVSQQGTSLYFTTIDVIQPMQELLIWYSEDYAQTRNYKLLSTNSCSKYTSSFIVLICSQKSYLLIFIVFAAGIPYEMTPTEHREPTEAETLLSATENVSMKYSS